MPVSRGEANKICSGHNGSLAILQNSNENKCIYRVPIGKPSRSTGLGRWIGVYKEKNSSTFEHIQSQRLSPPCKEQFARENFNCCVLSKIDHGEVLWSMFLKVGPCSRNTHRPFVCHRPIGKYCGCHRKVLRHGVLFRIDPWKRYWHKQRILMISFRNKEQKPHAGFEPAMVDPLPLSFSSSVYFFLSPARKNNLFRLFLRKKRFRWRFSKPFWLHFWSRDCWWCATSCLKMKSCIRRLGLKIKPDTVKKKTSLETSVSEELIMV